jgi:hypothetical protein
MPINSTNWNNAPRYAKCIDSRRSHITSSVRKKFPRFEMGGFTSGNYFLFRSLRDLMQFFHALLCHAKVELSKIDLYYTRALEAKQNSGFSLN